MSHVDDGMIHAYLDGAYPAGSAQGEEIEAHFEACVDCRVLLENARELKERSQVVLHRLAPPDIAVPPFEEILARRERGRTGSAAAAVVPIDADSPAARRRRRLPPMPIAWAASLMLALGAGWMARAFLWPERLGEISPASDAASIAPAEAERLSPQSARTEADSAADVPAMATTPVAPPAANVAGFEDRRAAGAAEAAPGLAERQVVAGAAAAVAAQKTRVDSQAARLRERVVEDAPAQAPRFMEARALGAVARVESAEQTVDLTDPSTDEDRLLRDYARATAAGAWKAEPFAMPMPAMIGYEPVAMLEAGDAVRTERALVDQSELLRTVYAVAGDSVELIQRLVQVALALDEVVVTGAVPARADSMRAGRRAPPAAPPPSLERNEVAAEAGVRTVRRLVVGDAGTDAFRAYNLVVSSANDRIVILKARIPVDALQALGTRVRQ